MNYHKGTRSKYNNMSEKMLIEQTKKELTEMQKFVRSFEMTKINQKDKIIDKRNVGFYIPLKRYDRLREYIGTKFTDSNYFSKSTMLDFMFYLLEGYLAGTYNDLEKFDDWYDRKIKEKA